MSDDKKPEDKIRPFSTIAGGKKTTSKKDKSSNINKSGNARHQIYVTDAQFKNAMDLIREDMNNTLQLGNLANTQHYFLVKFLTERGIIKEEEFTKFMQEELIKLNKEGNK